MKAYRLLMKTIENLLMLFLMATVVIVTFQVFFRYVLKSPIGWSEQICRLLFLWSIMLGIPVIFDRKVDMVFDIIYNNYSMKGKRIASILFNIIGLVFSVFYFICGMQLCIRTGSRMTAGIKMPMNVLYGAQPVCAVLLILVFIVRIIESIRMPTKEEEIK